MENLARMPDRWGGALLGALVVVVLVLLAVSLGAQPQRGQNTGLLDAVDECVTLEVAGMGTATFAVQGAFVGTIGWFYRTANMPLVALSATRVDSPALPVATTMYPGQWTASILGAESVQACVSAYSSGAATVTVSAVPIAADSRPPCNPVTKLSGRCRP